MANVENLPGVVPLSPDKDLSPEVFTRLVRGVENKMIRVLRAHYAEHRLQYGPEYSLSIVLTLRAALVAVVADLVPENDMHAFVEALTKYRAN